MMVKICGITNREDAQAAIDGGAAALGFNFYPASPRYITEDAAAAILDALTADVLKVGVFVNEDGAAAARRLALDVVQLHGPGCAAPLTVRVWRAVSAGPGFAVASLGAVDGEAVLLDAAAGGLYGGTGRTFDWTLAAGAPKKIIVAGGLDSTNVREAIERARPWGVDACSRIESAPGRKDHVKMAAFLKAARMENS